MDELIVFSHLRWDFVWQRPQHVVSRLAPHHDRVVIVEEPQWRSSIETPRLHRQRDTDVDRIWLEVPGHGGHLGFDAPQAQSYSNMLAAELGCRARPGRVHRTAWLYTPLALPLAEACAADVIVYDVMDDLSAFAHASPSIAAAQRRALDVADHVFTGGRSLQRLVEPHRADAQCFPSGVDLEHFGRAVQRRAARDDRRPIAGYVGVIDERLDLALIADLAAELTEWDIVMVGPVAKIDPGALPQAPNLLFVGPRSYADLPDVLGGFDVALMPFALNDATRSISPTKSLEYLAAGLPVVSTRVPDVVTDLGKVVHLADDASGFAAHCRAARDGTAVENPTACIALLRWNQWDSIVARMREHMTPPTTDAMAAGS